MGWEGWRRSDLTGWGMADSGDSIPQASNLVFQVDLNGSITPQIGTGGTFARASAIAYANGTGETALVTASSGNPATPAFPYLGSGSVGGMQFQGARRNRLIESAFDTGAWGFIGGTTDKQVNTNTAPDNTLTGAQFTANAGGLFQDDVAAASQSVVFSCWVRAPSGTIAGRVRVEGSTGGTPEQTDATFTATTTWQRVHVYKAFSASATGNIRSSVRVDGSATLQVWGAQLEIVVDSGVTGGEMKTPSPYMDTQAGSEVTTVSDDLSYPSSNVTNAMQIGTISIWVNTPWNEADFAGTREKGFLSMADFQLFLGNDGASGNFEFFYGSGSGNMLNVADAWTRNVWRHYVVAWDNSGAAITVQAYRNATQIGTNTASTPTTPTAATFALGGRSSVAFEEYFLDGILAKVKWWNVKLTPTEITTLHNLEKTGFGL